MESRGFFQNVQTTVPWTFHQTEIYMSEQQISLFYRHMFFCFECPLKTSKNKCVKSNPYWLHGTDKLKKMGLSRFLPSVSLQLHVFFSLVKVFPIDWRMSFVWIDYLSRDRRKFTLLILTEFKWINQLLFSMKSFWITRS